MYIGPGPRPRGRRLMGPSAFTAIRSLRRDQSVKSAKVAKGTARRILRFVRPYRGCWSSSSRWSSSTPW